MLRSRPREPICVLLAALQVSIFVTAAFGQGDTDPASKRLLSLHVEPEVILPVADTAEVFGLGGAMAIAGSYPLGKAGNASLRFGLQYLYAPTAAVPTLSLATGSAGLGYDLRFGKRWSLLGYADGGYSYCFVNNLADIPYSAYSKIEGMGMAFAKTGLALRFFPGTDWSIDAGGAFEYQAGLHSGLAFSLGSSFALKPRAPRALTSTYTNAVKPTLLKIDNSETLPAGSKGLYINTLGVAPVFPVFFTYYDSEGLGSIRLTNATGESLNGVGISFLIGDFMNAPQALMGLPALTAGESAEIPLTALFSDRILSVTERTKVQAEIAVSFDIGGDHREEKVVANLNVMDRNAMTWDDDRKAAPFVTPKDTPVINFAKNVVGAVKGKGSAVVNKNLSVAMALHEALSSYGLSYVIDPKSSYSDLSSQMGQVDYLQFPRQTLSFKAGDCDDLSILNCALLESVGVDTAFITVPGHIFMAFSLGIPPDEARKNFNRYDDLILQETDSWLPVEITQIDGGFLKAWELGAREWRENASKSLAKIYPLRDAWKLYEPVFFRGEDIQVGAPQTEAFLTAFLQEQIRFIEQEIYPQVARLQADIRSSKNDPKAVNKLGVLYAKYGLYDRAQAAFDDILKNVEYVPALVNLGNISYIGGTLDRADEYYERALKADPTSSTALLGLARLNHDLENYGAVKKFYDQLAAVDRSLADRFSYLNLKGEEATRAGNISGAKEEQVWGE